MIERFAREVCVVTDELHPFTAGGIGRLLHNAIREALRASPDLRIAVLIAGAGVDPRAVEAYFGERVVARAAPFSQGSQPLRHGQRTFPPASAYESEWQAQSADLLLALLRWADEGMRPRIIEFPDYRGWAHCTAQEKRLGLAFHDAEIVARLHSTDGVLQRFEGRALLNHQSSGVDLERKSLLDVDRVVAPLRSVAEFNQRHYGFPASWLERVRVEFPPVVEGRSTIERGPSAGRRDLVFPTKVQSCKRPDLFVRGAALFMSRNAGFDGDAVLACHVADEALLERVMKLVPAGLAKRFRLTSSGEERASAIAGSIAVIPSDWESLNFAAYEAAAAGATLVLNERCVAFAEGSPFRDGANSHLFDGTPDGLADALERAWTAPARGPIDVQPAPSYWLDGERVAAPARRKSSALATVVIPHRNLGEYLPRTVAQVAASSHPNLEIIVVDDASTRDVDAEALDQLERSGSVNGRPVRVLRSPVNRGLSGARNLAIRHANGEYVLPLDADDGVAPEFIEAAVAALENEPEHDVVVPTCGYFASDAALAAGTFSGFATFLGDAPSAGLAANRFSTATALLRRSLFRQFQYDERLPSFEDWDLYLRLALDGRRFLVTNDVQFFYRRRAASMITGVSPSRHLDLQARLLDALAGVPASVRLSALVVPTANCVRAAGHIHPASHVGDRPLRYVVADRLNDGLKKLSSVHRLAKRLVAAARRPPGGG